MSTRSLEKALPVECIHEIISHLTHDCKALNSCLRTNRLFARLTAPLLYKNPWKYFEVEEEEELYKRELNPKGALLLRTYISCINEQPTESTEEGTSFSSSTIMDYVALTRHINIPILYRFLEVRIAATASCGDRSRKTQETFFALSEAFGNRCSNVESLVTCWHSAVDIFTSMVQKFPNIAHLDLLQYENTDETLKFITSNCKRLRVFKFTVRGCSAALLNSFLDSQEDGYLEELCIKITMAPRLLLAGLTPSVVAKITDLRINGLHIDHAMDNLRFRKLQSLDLSDCHSVDEKTFNALEFGQMITEINLSETKVSEEAIVALATHCKHNLRKLIMLPCGAADSVEQGIKALATHCPNLIEFRLDVIRVEIRAIMELVQSCKKLQILVLGGVDVNNEDSLLDELMHTICVNIGESICALDVREWTISDQAVIDLVSACHNLNKLVLRYCRNVNDDCITKICQNLAGTLRHLDVANCPLVTPNGIVTAEEELVNCRIIHASRLLL
ncbi:F-box/LRR-repeat protein 2-like isoform X2 [Gigaspora margarita]|uniref:F-box/LRR-repeat protein 2-like isoform X2 n=1 Tax=Gigaspora margarita TaxID=4874 RepID=A0A8H3XD95_GIGMA|nr:F-box/LRR-repeat protein 2-like isoform X2 [Gigaspora margarita]